MKTVLFECLLIGAGGFAGAICRFAISSLCKFALATSFPVGTLIANVSGCFLIGLLMGSGYDEANRNLKLMFGVGFLGALTTFSTFGAETVSHASEQNYGVVVGNVVLNLAFGLVAVVAGIWCGKRFFAA